MILAAFVGLSQRGEDDAAIATIRAGRLDGFADLYRRHADKLYALFTRLVGPISEREDLIQESFVESYRALPSFRGDSSFATFLHRIAVRVGCDFLARRARHQRVSVDEAALQELLLDRAAPQVSPEASAESRLELERAFRLLDSLSAKRRAAFVLVAVEGLSLAEAAQVLGIDEQAVKQRVLSARKELSARLNREPVGHRHA
jgi:RNA polymerase sigma-70 factor (ECF subfamily)